MKSGLFISVLKRLSAKKKNIYLYLYCICCYLAVVCMLSGCLFYDTLPVFVSFLPFIFIVPPG